MYLISSNKKRRKLSFWSSKKNNDLLLFANNNIDSLLLTDNKKTYNLKDHQQFKGVLLFKREERIKGYKLTTKKLQRFELINFSTDPDLLSDSKVPNCHEKKHTSYNQKVYKRKPKDYSYITFINPNYFLFLMRYKKPKWAYLEGDPYLKGSALKIEDIDTMTIDFDFVRLNPKVRRILEGEEKAGGRS